MTICKDVHLHEPHSRFTSAVHSKDMPEHEPEIHYTSAARSVQYSTRESHDDVDRRPKFASASTLSGKTENCTEASRKEVVLAGHRVEDVVLAGRQVNDVVQAGRHVDDVVDNDLQHQHHHSHYHRHHHQRDDHQQHLVSPSLSPSV